MLTAQYAMTAHIIGLQIPLKRRQGIITHFRATQNDAGIWGLHPLDEGSLFVTTLVYVAARLLGTPSNAPWLQGARRMFDLEGGVQRIPTWGKVWLALLRLYDWEGVNPILADVWALPSRVPFHPANFYCHTRSIYLGLAVLYAERFVAAQAPVLDEIRGELYAGRYDTIDFRACANDIREEDAPFRASAGLRAVFGLSRLYERVQPKSLARRVLRQLREGMRRDLRASNYLSLSPVNGLLTILALWSDDPDDADLKLAVEKLDAWFWEDAREGSRVAGAGSVCWDTSFALQALSALPESDGAEALARGASFLAGQQIERPNFDYRAAHRIDPSGGWCFSEVGHGWPVSDCTAEALLGLLHTRPESLGREGAARGGRFILRCQNDDGGFGSYEPSKTSFPLEWMNPSEMFGGCMAERSYNECTGSSLMALCEIRRRYPDLLRQRIERSIDHARSFLMKAQNADGTWDAAWGVHYIYATMFGVRGLLAAGVPPTDQRIRKACQWLLARQRPDGGWGEHHSSCTEGRYVSAPAGLCVQTAWALTTLVEANDPDRAAMKRAAGFLDRSQLASGEWPNDEFTGVFFATALLNYRMYGQYFPVMALALWNRHLSKNE
jgi:lanosterol synthase